MQAMQKISELLGNMFSQAVEEAAATAPPTEGEFAGQITTTPDVAGRLDALYKSGLPRGEYCGFQSFDNLYRPRLGEFTVVTGTPGSGKSTFIDNILCYLAFTWDWRIGVFSAENLPAERHIMNLIAIASGMPFFSGPSERIQPVDMWAWRDAVIDHFKIMDPKDENRTIEKILTMARLLIDQYSIKGLLLDPYNELDHNRPAWMQETEYISRFLTQVRQFARRHNVHIWVVAHPAKMYRGKDGKYPRPSLYDISGSAHWRNKADMGLVVDRNYETKETTVYVDKVRFRENGQLGACSFKYDKITGRYHDIGLIKEKN